MGNLFPGFSLLVANPWGLAALVSLLAIVAIHCLKKPSREIPISIYFLLPKPESTPQQGSRLSKLTRSLPFWLQLLICSLLALTLAQPKVLKTTEQLRFAAIVDSTLSMRAFSSELPTAAANLLGELYKLSPQIEWLLLSSDNTAPVLYRGNNLQELRQALAKFSPSTAGADFTASINTALAFTKSQKNLAIISDRRIAQHSEIAQIGVGRKIPNAGFLGSRIFRDGDNFIWRTAIRNYGTVPVETTWQLFSSEEQLATQSLRLAPQETRVIKGLLPRKTIQARLELSNDDFAPDNQLPLVTTLERNLRVRVAVDCPIPEYFNRLFSILNGTELVGTLHKSHLAVRGLQTPQDNLPTEHGIYFLFEGNPSNSFTGPTASDTNKLNEDLNWGGLVAGSSFALQPQESDQVLVWLNQKPLIFYREVLTNENKYRQLFFNLDPRYSNLEKLPAFALIVKRFTELVRQEIPGYQRQNYPNTAEKFRLPFQADSALEISFKSLVDGSKTKATGRQLRLSALPGFIEAQSNGDRIEESAVYYSANQESDFSRAESFESLENGALGVVNGIAEQGWILEILLLFLGAMMLLLWHVMRVKTQLEGRS